MSDEAMDTDEGGEAQPLALAINGGAPLLHELQTKNPHSVELSLTSAGKISGSVKVYDEDPEKALERAAAILDKIRTRYPS